MSNSCADTELGRIGLLRVPLSVRQRRASRGGFFLRPPAVEVHKKICHFIYLVFHDMHIPPQPYDQKLCSRFARCLMEPARVLFFASFLLLKPIRDLPRAQSENKQIEPKWRRKHPSSAAQHVVIAHPTLTDLR